MSASCGIARHPSARPCNIQAEVHNRNGHPRWWCHVHGAPAWAANGRRLQQCPGASSSDGDPEILHLDPSAFGGGVGLWGAVSSVYCTAQLPHESGVHVHARDDPDGTKVIDRTYDVVELAIGGEIITIDAASATAVLVANVFDLELKRLTCPHCSEVHLDREKFGAMAHRKHQCNRCGRAFYDPDGSPSISNPLAGLRSVTPHPVGAEGRLVLKQADHPGGLAVWGSNAALFWTRRQPEVEGLHIHAWNAGGELTIDDTFGAVTIDGLELDRRMVQALMVQQSLNYLRGRIAALDCPSCKSPHFDEGESALRPHVEHSCMFCGADFVAPGRRHGLVSNPLHRVLEQLKPAAPPRHGER